LPLVFEKQGKCVSADADTILNGILGTYIKVISFDSYLERGNLPPAALTCAPTRTLVLSVRATAAIVSAGFAAALERFARFAFAGTNFVGASDPRSS
jgi:hypothetical protein